MESTRFVSPPDLANRVGKAATDAVASARRAPLERDAVGVPGTEQLLRLLYRQLRSLAGPRPDLDDIVQAAAERALKSLASFEGRSSLSTWTYAVAYRTLLDHDRWRLRFLRRFSYTEEVQAPERSEPCDSEALLLEAERARRLYRALDQLPAAKRAVVVLIDLEGLSASEVSRIVDANERTVRSRLRDARAKLCALLSQDPVFQGAREP